MKKILITGKQGYVSNELKIYLNQFSSYYDIDIVSVRDDLWKKVDFSKYNVIIHTAGLVHQNFKTNKLESEYYRVNRDLTANIYDKAIAEGIKQFIYISSMSVFGKQKGIINEKTVPNPVDYYGKSKLAAEKYLINESKIKTAILRPPMIYGKNCPGNYKKLSNLAKKINIFPVVKNNRSMIYIENLCEFIRLIIDEEDSGVYHPQNKDYVCTTNMMKQIAKQNDNKIAFIHGFNRLVKKSNIRILVKVFGDLVYDKELSKYKKDYNVRGFDESIYFSEK